MGIKCGDNTDEANHFCVLKVFRRFELWLLIELFGVSARFWYQVYKLRNEFDVVGTFVFIAIRYLGISFV